MSFFKKSFETITKRLSKMAEELMEHSEEHSRTAYVKQERACDLNAEAEQHHKEAQRCAETSLRLQTLIGG